MPALTALYNTIKGTPLLTDALATYDNGQNGVALFIGEVPKDSRLPAISLIQSGANSQDTTRGFRGGHCYVTLRLWGDKTHSSKSLRKTAMDIWDSLDRACLEGDANFDIQGCYCTIPVYIEDSEGYGGFLLNVDLSIIEK